MIRTSSLTKIYGTTTALADVDLEVPRGSVFGLVGPNGAGKSTLLGLLAGIRRPTGGEIAIDAPRAQRTLMPDTPMFEPWLTAREVLSLALRASTGRRDPARVAEVLEGVGLADAADRRSGGFSRGMLQRLGFGAAIAAEPDLIMLDEPASALDPQGRRDILDFIARLRGTATVLFSSHILDDVQDVCDAVAVLDRGRLLFQGGLDDLLGPGGGSRVRVDLASDPEPFLRLVAGADWVAGTEVRGRTVILVVTSPQQAQVEIPRCLAESGSRLVALGADTQALEDVFLGLTR